MENKIYIAQYIGAKYENGEREYMAIPYRSIGKADKARNTMIYCDTLAVVKVNDNN